ncbi:MAG: hypothetical protein R3B99_18460 [Polyangiales bacterium]
MPSAAALARALVALVFAEVRPDEHALLATLESIRAALVGDAASIVHVETLVASGPPASACPTVGLVPIAAKLALAFARGGGTELALLAAYERAEDVLASLYVGEGFGERAARIEASIEITRAVARYGRPHVEDDERPSAPCQLTLAVDESRAA